ncbi:MAG: TRAP transporter small permease [Campylobacter sp.]|uniref:TRAP transporter small permease n=1 Tax=Campylobacter sp. TaxID=205 RepID=UPI002A8F2623|nr:TRAP transporter small permease [Campylobacter sp.]MCI6695779.1 TRAP transporter small permease [Campylobacter sp.]MCI6818987.1 TRAP transporter small permease [Campylobacter sp.]MDY4859504.1 TRAP transporter small permease [Campylobacter sp.]
MKVKVPFSRLAQSRKLRKAFLKVDRFISRMDKTVAVFGLAAGILIIAANVLVRYTSSVFPIVGATINMTWAEETARYCFMWSAFFAAAHGFRNGVHISVTFVVEFFSKNIQKFIIISGHALSSIFLAFMAYASIDVCVLNAEIGYMSEAIRAVPLWVFLLFLPISFCAATFRSVEKIYLISKTPADELLVNLEKEMINDTTSKGAL